METINKEELTRVQRDSDGKYNLINAQGKLFFDEWFECIGYFDEGLARVQRTNREFCKIDKTGKIVVSK